MGNYPSINSDTLTGRCSKKRLDLYFISKTLTSRTSLISIKNGHHDFEI